VTATSNRPAGGFYIGVGCPGCGGSLKLDTDFFVTSCQHCGSVLRIIQPDAPVAYLIRNVVSDNDARVRLDRYLKERREPLTGSALMFKRLYYPYWKVDGTVLKLRNKIERRVYVSESDSSRETVMENPHTDITVSPYKLTVGAGCLTRSIPDTLGLRSETITLAPLSNENLDAEIDLLSVERSQKDVQRRVQAAVATLGGIDRPEFGTNITRLFDPMYSLVYFPYLIVESYSPHYRRFALDGLTGAVLGDIVSSEDYGLPEAGPDGAAGEPLSENPPQTQFGELGVDFHRCANCGVDLASELSYVYVCRNCHELTSLGSTGYKLSEVSVADGDLSEQANLVPFWWFRLPEDQMAQVNALLGGLDRPDRLVIPALRTNNIEAFLRLAKRMTVASPRIPAHPVEQLDSRFLSVRVGLPEAIARAEMLLIKELMALGRRDQDLKVELTPVEIGLTYVPFRADSYFYVDTVLGAVSLEQTLLR
jgi:hypothetical protein